MVLLTSLKLEVQLSAGVWTDLAADVVAADRIHCYRGMIGSGPTDRVAMTGTLAFSLRNDAHNSGGTLGWYSPNHLSVRTGWTFGIPVRLRLRYSGVDYTMWTGRIRTILPVPGSHMSRRVYVTAEDCLGDFSASTVREMTPQINQSETTLLTALVNALPANAQPPATSFDTALDTFPYAFDDVGGGASAMTLAANVVLSSLGKLFAAADGTLTYLNRQTLSTAPQAFSLTTHSGAFLAEGGSGLALPSSLDGVYNRVRVSVHPRTVDTSATTVLYALQVGSAAAPSVTSIGPGQTLELWGDYHDASNTLKLIGGTAFVTPVAGTDYRATSNPDDTGTDYTTSITVTAYGFASSVKFVILNPILNTIYVTKLQLRGKGVYDNNPVTMESYTAEAYGNRVLNLDLPYQGDSNLAQAFADYLKTQYVSFSNQADQISVNPQADATSMAAILAAEIGQVFFATESVTGLNTSLMIHGIALEITPTKGAAPFVVARLKTAPQIVTQIWVLDDAVASVLDSTTVLAFL